MEIGGIVFRMGGVLGAGGFGVVRKAVSLGPNGQRVAIKGEFLDKTEYDDSYDKQDTELRKVLQSCKGTVKHFVNTRKTYNFKNNPKPFFLDVEDKDLRKIAFIAR